MKRILPIFISALLILLFGLGGILYILRSTPPVVIDWVRINDAVMNYAQYEDRDLMIIHELLHEEDRLKDYMSGFGFKLFIFLCIYIGIITAAVIGFYIYCVHKILKPFKKLQSFARNIAAGNLDIPLSMDTGNNFGAFTESFDLMREELKNARENERNANQSKKELVASLSHDIKTPIASIKAVTELMLVKSPEHMEALNVIIKKADQIDLLITNMFHAALEELEQLKVEPSEIPSTDLYELIRNADYDNRVTVTNIPECIITADKARLQQVFDNIISNSYKYAGTAIAINAYFEDKYLAIEISDSGAGVTPGEFPLIFKKFYRGENAAGKSGSGLGLHITKHLINKMGGDIICIQNESGFTVKILLAL